MGLGVVGEKIFVVWCCLAFSACATPAQRIDKLAQQFQFTRTVFSGTRFNHVVYSNHAPRSVAGSLHVYLEGDGLPWRNETEISDDPTPRAPLALRLMARDAQPSVYVGRPCYHGFAHEPPCSPLSWTQHRYAPAVLESMEQVLHHVIERAGAERVVLVGYSGGGVIAMLLAARIKQTLGVVTIAANLDIEAWALVHAYTPLAGSLNPARMAILPSSIKQLHLVGADDSNVPPVLLQPEVFRQQARLQIVEGFDHSCCWVEQWPRLICEDENLSSEFCEPRSDR